MTAKVEQLLTIPEYQPYLSPLEEDPGAEEYYYFYDDENNFEK